MNDTSSGRITTLLYDTILIQDPKTGEPVSRDYLRVWLQSANGGLEALVYVDRETGKRMIQGFCD